MNNILLWFWTGAVSAAVLWWITMLFCVAFIGPLELRRMFRNLNKSHEDERLKK